MNEVMNFTATGDMVIVPRARYEALVSRLEDQRDFHEGVSDIEEGAELLAGDFVERLLNADSPLKEWRIYRGMSQTELAAAAGVRQATISALEKEKGSAPRLDNARRIAETLRCDLDDLF